MSPRLEGLPPLDRDSLAADPIEQFAGWFELAREQVPLAEAMTLATADPAGDPDARMVLLKGFGAAGFRFFSNYESVKGEELAARPRAALVIYWRELDRQVRVRGPVSRLSAEDSDAYFAGRPRDSQLGATSRRRAGRSRTGPSWRMRSSGWSASSRAPRSLAPRTGAATGSSPR